MLGPYRIIDLTDETAFLTGRLLADLGAHVVKVEPPGGDVARRFPPFAAPGGGAAGTQGAGGGADGGTGDLERSLYWLAYNAGKRGITLDLGAPEGRRLLLALAERADFLIESFTPGHLDALGIGHGELARRNPRLIHVSITPFGSTGPRSGQLATDLEVWAAGGCLSMAGERDGEPLRVSVAQSPMWAGMHGAVAALVALAARARTGRGQHADVSAQLACLAALSHAPAFWDMLGENPVRDGGYLGGRSVTGARMRVFWPCRDGYLNFIIYGGAAGRHTNRELTAWMAECGAAPDWMVAMNWDLFDVRTVTQEEIDRLEEPIEAFFRGLTKEEFATGALQRSMLGYPVATAADIAANPQLKARDFWRDLQHPQLGGPLRYPGAFARFETWDAAPRRRAPHLGEHNGEVLGGDLGLGDDEIAALRAKGVI